MIIPLTSSVSPKLPPTFPSILICSKLTSLRLKSATETTESTAILDRCYRWLETILDPSGIIAQFFLNLKYLQIHEFTATNNHFHEYPITWQSLPFSELQYHKLYHIHLQF